MAKLANLARMTTATTSTGTITLGSAVSGYLTFAEAGVADGDIIVYGIKDGADSETGTGVYTSSGTTLTRVVTKSTNSDSAISLSGTAEVYTTARAEDIVPDEARRNALLNAIYQSKLFGDYRRFLNMFATGFNAATDTLRGINAGSSSNYTATPTSAIVSYVAPTATNTQISTSGKTLIGTMVDNGGLAAAFDADTTQTNAEGAAALTAAAGYDASNVGVDWGSGTTKTVVEFRLWASSNFGINAGAGGAAIKLQGSSDNSTWNDLYTSGTVLTTGGSTLTVSSGITTTTAYRYHRIAINGNGANATLLAEVQFYELVYGNMTLVTTAQTSDASANRARALVEFDNTATPTLDTDLTVEVTCNGGTNWAAGTLSSVSTNGQAGRKIAEIADTACTAGTSFAARVKTLNNKNVPIYGVTVTVH